MIARRFQTLAILLLLVVPQASWSAAMCLLDCEWWAVPASEDQSTATAAAGETCHSDSDTTAAERMSPGASRCVELAWDAPAQAERKGTRDVALRAACAQSLGLSAPVRDGAPIVATITTLPHPSPGLHTVRRI